MEPTDNASFLPRIGDLAPSFEALGWGIFFLKINTLISYQILI